jgi:ubiquitin carboxyl-terminal hydrolase L5
MSWCTIENDPGVFSELINQIGVKGIQMADIYSIDAEEIKKLDPVYGIVFLFQWVGKDDRKTIPENEIPSNMFYAKQVNFI